MQCFDLCFYCFYLSKISIAHHFLVFVYLYFDEFFYVVFERLLDGIFFILLSVFVRLYLIFYLRDCSSAGYTQLTTYLHSYCFIIIAILCWAYDGMFAKSKSPDLCFPSHLNWVFSSSIEVSHVGYMGFCQIEIHASHLI